MARGIVAALAGEAVLIAVLLTVALDLQAHKRVERLGGVNIWAYRGPVMRRKAQNEIRVAVVGGTLAFGWGVAASEALAPSVRQLVALEIDKPGSALGPFTAVTLGAIGLAPGQYASWIDRFAYLRPDVICIVGDPRGHRGGGRSLLPDRESTLFLLFGYAPMLPLVVEEKGRLLGSSLLKAVGSAATDADHAVAGLLPRPSSDDEGRESAAGYARAFEAAARAALRTGAAVVIVAPPYESADDVRDHEALAGIVASRFAGERRVRFVDLGDAPDIYDEGVWLQDLTFSTAGHAKAAEYVTPAVLDLIAAR
jgi:hypothetical protein